jgi:heme A synthase
MSGYPRWFNWYFVSLIVTWIFITGVLMTPTALDSRFQIDMGWRLSGDSRVLVSALHALAAFAVAMLLGTLWSIHMRKEWRQNRKRLSGAILTSMWFVLIFTGVGLYYFGSESLLNASSLIHTMTGFAVTIFFVIHIFSKARA